MLVNKNRLFERNKKLIRPLLINKVSIPYQSRSLLKVVMETDPIIRVVLLDIEGTTSSISFVSDVLFPYIRRELRGYLDAHWDNEQLKQDIELLR